MSDYFTALDIDTITSLPLTLLGDPILRQLAQTVADPTASDIKILADAMVGTMMAANGVGLAAPQVGVSARLFVYWVPKERGNISQDVAPTIIINPEIVPLSQEQEHDWEGCLSIPNLQGLVPRYRHIGWQGYGLDGKIMAGEAKDFQARVMQHELDHLDGVVYLDRMTNLLSLGFVDVIKARS
ncbi:MAG: peptide deformylase [Alphaproteobacteria bacterium]